MTASMYFTAVSKNAVICSKIKGKIAYILTTTLQSQL